MQLFITPFLQSNNIITIDDSNIIHQIKRVLRLQKGSSFFVQNKQQGIITRHKVVIVNLTDQKIITTIESTKNQPSYTKTKTMIIAMPNKWQKAELIVQKLTEIGIQQIVFWPSDKSVIRQSNSNKMYRLEKIAKEALEQSRGWTLPEIHFESNIKKHLKNQKIVIFDHILDTNKSCNSTDKKTIGIIGPEGGFTLKDYEFFGDDFCIQSLGNTILRTETAAIVGAWVLMSHSEPFQD